MLFKIQGASSRLCVVIDEIAAFAIGVYEYPTDTTIDRILTIHLKQSSKQLQVTMTEEQARHAMTELEQCVS